MTRPRYTWRVVIITLLVFAVWAGLGTRLAALHLGPNAGLKDKIQKTRVREKKLTGPRGRVMDRNGQFLALDLAVRNVCVSPEDVMSNGHVRVLSGLLASQLGMDPAEVKQVLTMDGRFYRVVYPRLHHEKGNQLEEQLRRFGFPTKSVWLEQDMARYYPLGSQLAHVIGFSNREGVGSAGIELKFNDYLRGREGLKVYEQDGKRREVYARRSLEIKPEAGADITLTIDQKLQHYVEQELDAAMEAHHAEGAWAIVQRVKTGEILAMASRPNYDLNAYSDSSDQERMNRAIGYTYEPGSTMKALVMAAAFNENLVTPQTVIDCEEGMWYFNGRPLRDYHPYPRLSVADVLKKSSNIGMAKLGLMLGEQRLQDYLHGFGIGRGTGISLPGEEAGIFHDVSKWSKISISRITMGHEVAVTALQMLNAFCCLANDGYLMKPYVVSQVQDASGTVIALNEPEVVGRPVREDVARLMCRLLGRVTEDGGTARRARVEGYSVAGKTGTAQKPIPGGYSHTDNIASFVGFLPAGKPEIGIIVVVDNPQPLHTGGVVAAPVFKIIAEQAVRYLDIPPLENESEVMISRAR